MENQITIPEAMNAVQKTTEQACKSPETARKFLRDAGLIDNPFKVIIAGSRTFTDYKKLKSVCDKLFGEETDIEIVSGGARGADELGEQYGKSKGFGVKIFPAKWNDYGKKAGYMRNVEMAEYANALIAFWDGKSKGTKMMIKLAYEHRLIVHIINLEKVAK